MDRSDRRRWRAIGTALALCIVLCPQTGVAVLAQEGAGKSAGRTGAPGQGETRDGWFSAVAGRGCDATGLCVCIERRGAGAGDFVYTYAPGEATELERDRSPTTVRATGLADDASRLDDEPRFSPNS
ncbi:hypothetical protein DFR50_12074 [Roseiarcus fermentans]|uniref:Secreted protein n=1 Tax=Roseiarcus fermentans TaxID=1473586 RepID=A0A366F5H4_9HYPH|nr:hypothetical protein [Roseiarcus fermentans]RBP09874.1 hypothetical protein DFR50_12074 [Roseiarcus fermentans]